MIMSWIWFSMVALSVLASIISGNGAVLASAALSGAQSGITLCLSIAGALCLWSGIGVLMEHGGITLWLSKSMMPILRKVFPSAQTDPHLASCLSGNICANILGLGNAATPMGVEAAKALARGKDTANDELCRLIVLNTASIQLIPGNVAAARSALGCTTPFDILPAVWCTSLLSALSGVLLAALWGRLKRHA